jgi:hypothetical protein
MDWLDEWWDEIEEYEADPERAGPSWFGRPLVGRHPITSRREEAAFAKYNAGRDYQDRVRPYNFLMSFHRHRLARGDGSTLLVAPFEEDAERRADAGAIDRSSGKSYRIQLGDSHLVLPDQVPVQTYGDYFDEYRVHPESKLADEFGNPCRPWSRGELHPRHVQATGIVRIGKESTRLTSGQPTDERTVLYREVGKCAECRREVVDSRAKYCSGACKQRAYRRRRQQRN